MKKCLSTFILLFYVLAIFGFDAALSLDDTFSTTTTPGGVDSSTNDYSNVSPSNIPPLQIIEVDEYTNCSKPVYFCGEPEVFQQLCEINNMTGNCTNEPWPSYVKTGSQYGIWSIMGLYWFLAIITLASMFICCYPRGLKEIHQTSSKVIISDNSSKKGPKRKISKK